MSAQSQAEQKPALTDVVQAPEAAPKPGAKLQTAGGFRVGQRVISKVFGMTLRGRITQIFIGIDGEPTLDITREWTSPPADREEAKERTEGGANNWYRSPGECQPWLNNPFEADGWVQASAAAQMHWRSGGKLLCARNAPKDALQLSSKPTYQRERQCINCRAELARHTAQEGTPMTATAEALKKARKTSTKKTSVAEIDPGTLDMPPLQLGDDVRVQTGRPDVAVITNLKAEQAQLLYADGTRIWMPLAALEKAMTQAQPGPKQIAHNAQAGGRKGATAPADQTPAEPDLPFPVTEAELADAEVQAATLDPVPAPVLVTVADIDPGRLGMLAVPLHQLVRSHCNVRHHYDPVAIEELAESLASQGQLENCTGRWNAKGQIEVVAGETRRRAWLHLQEQGRADKGQPVMVHVRDLSDAEALGISATENMRRRSMTPLEECEAMHRLNDAGRSVEEIQAMFGYKNGQPVADRILVAKNLHTKARDLLDQGELSLACAFVIARAPGQDLQLSMTNAATASYNRASAGELTRRLTQGQFLVKNAKFNVEKSGLDIRRDLFDAFEPYFEDKAAALNAQIAWIEAKAERLRAKNKHEFVHVITDGKFERYGHGPYIGWAKDGEGGLVYVLHPYSGEVRQEDRVELRASTTEEGQKVREISESAYEEAHERRALALREAVVGSTHLTLALTVWGLILGGSSGDGRVRLSEINGLPESKSRAEKMPELTAQAQALSELLAPIKTKSTAYHTVLTGPMPDADLLLEWLIGLTDEALLGHLNTLVAVTAYNWANNKSPARPEYARLAALTDAPERLAAHFTLTDEWLKRYPRPDLLALAEEAGLGRALVEDCSTLKEMRARILEHAQRLHAEGFVPKLVQFPAAPSSMTAADLAQAGSEGQG